MFTAIKIKRHHPKHYLIGVPIRARNRVPNTYTHHRPDFSATQPCVINNRTHKSAPRGQPRYVHPHIRTLSRGHHNFGEQKRQERQSSSLDFVIYGARLRVCIKESTPPDDSEKLFLSFSLSLSCNRGVRTFIYIRRNGAFFRGFPCVRV